MYILGRRPDEFGLVPDQEGFVSFKELLQALHEEPEWRYVRRSHLNEVLMGGNRQLFDVRQDRIRTRDRWWTFDFQLHEMSPPNLLFTGIRRKGHKAAMEYGLRSSAGKYLALSAQKEMALRIGRRRDPQPIVLEVRAVAAQKAGVLLCALGELFLSPRIPAECIAGPPLPKEPYEPLTLGGPKVSAAMRKRTDSTAGTFFLDLERDPDPSRGARGRKRRGWKEEARKKRRRHQ